MALTNFLVGLVMNKVPRHSIFPSLCKPPGLVETMKSTCAACPLGGSTGHRSYLYGTMTAPMSLSTRIHLDTLRKFQYLVHLLNRLATPMLGSQDGFLYNATSSNNFADYLSWELIDWEEHEDGSILTLKAAEGFDFRDLVLYQFSTTEPEFGLFKVTGGGGFGVAPFVNDEVEFVHPSSQAGRSRPSIKRIVGSNVGARTIRVLVDRKCEGAMVSGDPNNMSPAAFYVKTWRQAGDPEKWMTIPETITFHGIPKQVTITSSDCDIYGHYYFKDAFGIDTAIAPPRLPSSEYNLPQTFAISGKRIDNGSWDDLTVEVCFSSWDYNLGHSNGRFFAETISDTAYRTRVALGSKMPNILYDYPSSLFDTYSEFRIEYNELTSVPTNETVALGCMNCRWSWNDRTLSVGNLSAPNGVRVLNSGQDNEEHHVCLMRKYRTSEMVDTNNDLLVDTFVYTPHQATGVSNFRKVCLQHGVCDQFALPVPNQRTGMGAHPFTVWWHYAGYWRQLWASVNIRMTQLLPGFSTYMNWKVARKHNPSLWSLLGSYGLSTPAGKHEQAIFPDWGVGYGEYETYGPDGNGDTILRRIHDGFDWDTKHDHTTCVFGNLATYPPQGHFPANVRQFKRQQDEIHYNNEHDDTTDLHLLKRYNICRTGYKLEKDTGDRKGRGFQHYAHVVEEEEDILCEAVDFSVTDSWQERFDCRAYVYSTPVSYLGKLRKLRIQFRRTITSCNGEEEKTHQTFGTRTVHSVTKLDAIRYRIEFANEENRWSYVRTIGPGNSIDEVNRWEEGGGAGFDYPPFFRSNSYYARNKEIGGDGGLRRGDAVIFNATVNGRSVAAKPFFVLDVTPFGGAAAPNYGTKYLYDGFISDGCWEADSDNTLVEEVDPITNEQMHSTISLPVVEAATGAGVGVTNFAILKVAIKTGVCLRNNRTDEIIRVSSVGAWANSIVTIEVERHVDGTTEVEILAGDTFEWLAVVEGMAGGYTPLTRRYEIDRPRTLGTDEYWVEYETNRIFVNTAKTVDIFYNVAGQPTNATTPGDSIYCYSDTFLVFSDPPSHVTGVPYAYEPNDMWVKYGGADAVANTPGYNPTNGLTRVASNPAIGQYSLSNESEYIKLTFHKDDAGRAFSFNVDTGVLANPPGNVDLTNDHNNFCKRYDVVIIGDDSGELSEYYGELVGSSADLRAGMCAWYPYRTGHLAHTPYQEDTYTNIPSNKITYECGTGDVWVDDDYLEEFTGKHCFKLPVKKVDYRARPSSEMVNRTIYTLNNIHQLKMDLAYGGSYGIGFGVDTGVSNTHEQYVCTLLGGSDWKYVLPQAIGEDAPEPKVFVLSEMEITGSYTKAATYRRDYPATYGWVTGATFLVNGSALPWGAMPDVHNEGGGWVFGSVATDEGGDPPPMKVLSSPDNWTYPNGYCGPEQTDPKVSNPMITTDSPGWGPGEGEEANFTFYPFLGLGGINGTYGGVIPGDAHAPFYGGLRGYGAGVQASVSALVMPEFIKKAPKGTVINAAWLEVSFEGLYVERSTFTPQNPLVWDGDNVAYDRVDSLALTGIKVVLVGYKPVADGIGVWTPLGASVSCTVTNGKLLVVEATELARALLHYADNDTYSIIGFIPGLMEEFIGAEGTAGQKLLGMIPRPSLAYSSEHNAWYVSSASYTSMNWDNLYTRKLVVDFTLPNSVSEREVIPFNMVSMNGV